jgi:large repetitive protein
MLTTSKIVSTALIACAVCLGSFLGFASNSSAYSNSPLLSNSPAVHPIVLLKPFFAPPGSTVQATGKNFPTSGLKFTLMQCAAGGQYNCRLIYTGLINSGGFQFSFRVPLSTAAGPYSIYANDSAKNTAVNTLTAISKITLRPVRGPVGATIFVTGVGFTASKSITVSFGQESNVMKTALSNASGWFTTSFVAPTDPSGVYNVNASDGNTCIFTGVTHDYEHCSIASYKMVSNLIPGTHLVAPGGSLSLTGTGWAASSRVNFTLSNEANLGYAISSAAGSFTTTVTIPTSTAAGTYTLTAKDSSGDLKQITFMVK